MHFGADCFSLQLNKLLLLMALIQGMLLQKIYSSKLLLDKGGWPYVNLIKLLNNLNNEYNFHISLMTLQ